MILFTLLKFVTGPVTKSKPEAGRGRGSDLIIIKMHIKNIYI